MKTSYNWLLPPLAAFALISCGENTPTGPDMTGIAETDQVFFSRTYNQCNINNSDYDCNCVAHINVEHRASAYKKYTGEFGSIHKPKMEADIEKMTATLAEKTMNRSDERVLEALTEDLHRLKVKLENGIEDIDKFKVPGLEQGATESCKLSD